MKILLITVAFALAALSGCSNDDRSAAPSSKGPAVPAAQPQPVALAPRHLYTLHEDGEYGYERGISENDAKNGQKTSALLMVRYLGNKDNVHSVETAEPPFKAVFSCKSPCQFIKAKQYVNGSLVKTETMPNTEGSMIWAVMQDAQNGFLTNPEPAQDKVKPE